MNETVYHVEEDESLSQGIIQALSTRTDKAEKQIQPLHTSIDPEALNELFDNRSSEGLVRFSHMGYQITTYSDGEITLEPLR